MSVAGKRLVGAMIRASLEQEQLHHHVFRVIDGLERELDMDYSAPPDTTFVRAINAPLKAILAACDAESLDGIEAGYRNLSKLEFDSCLAALCSKITIASELEQQLPKPARLEFWLANVESTRRGIPPVLRNLPEPNADSPEQIADLLSVDLEWIVATCPDHDPLFSRWGRIWKVGQLHGECERISLNYPRREMWWFCKGLGLTAEQQRFLHFVKKDGLRKEFEQIRSSIDEVRVTIAATYHGRDSRHKSEDHSATIKRRLNVWLVGSLALWKPQLTATLYTAYTGDELSRQNAAKVIGQVHRDVPSSRPKPARQRPL